MEVVEILTIKEKAFANNSFQLSISLPNKESIDINLTNPNTAYLDALFEWYFETYILQPFTDSRQREAPQAILHYGEGLFISIFNKGIQSYYESFVTKDFTRTLRIEVVGDSLAFQSIYWESLKHPNHDAPLACRGVSIVRKAQRPVVTEATINESPAINVLLVTARPNEEEDVAYRTIQRPLVELISRTTLPINCVILRPGTVDSLISHIEQNPNLYHIVHFDTHGKLLEFSEYNELRERYDETVSSGKTNDLSFDLNEEHFGGKRKPFLFFESSEKGKARPIDASQIGSLLQNANVPICILNACESANHESMAENETSFGRVLTKKGVQLVVAMRYSVTVSAAELFMKTFYEQLYNRKSIDLAISGARNALFRRKYRLAHFNKIISLEDWILPVVFANNVLEINLRKFKSEEENNFVLRKQIPDQALQFLKYGFHGRDLDILKIEKNLLMRSNVLLLQGLGGAGKTTLLKHLIEWWQTTGFIKKAFYFGYDVKAFTLDEIIFQIGQEIYTPELFAEFIGKQRVVQYENIIKELKSDRYALIIDNAESITAESLAIPNTLDLDQRKYLKGFLSRLKGCVSVIIVGSRSQEEWLSEGTFENNCYVLPGLDWESSLAFADAIIKSLGNVDRKVLEQVSTQELMKLLAGNPLAIKAIIPTLKSKSTERILFELKQGLGTIDEHNIQTKTESVLKCIEYAHSNLSANAQATLKSRAPFISYVNVMPETIVDYFEILSEKGIFKMHQFDSLDDVINEAVQNGFMQGVDKQDPSNRIMQLQPLSSFFIKNRLLSERDNEIKTLDRAFVKYYEIKARAISRYIRSKRNEEKELGIYYMRYEYENILNVLSSLMNQGQNILLYYDLVDAYLERQGNTKDRLGIATQILAVLDQARFNKAVVEVASNILHITIRLSQLYQIQTQFGKSKELLMSALNKVETTNSLQPIRNLTKAEIYHNLGITNRLEQHFDLAIENYKKSLAIYELEGSEEDRGMILQNLGNVYSQTSDFIKAEQCYTQALDIWKKEGDIIRQGRLYMNLGQNENVRKQYENAVRYSNMALKILYNRTTPDVIGSIYTNKAMSEYNLKNFKQSKEDCYKALEMFNMAQEVFLQARVFMRMALIETELNNQQAAQTFFYKALEIQLQFPDDVRLLEIILSEILNYVVRSNSKNFGLKIVSEVTSAFKPGEGPDLRSFTESVGKLK